MKKSRLKSLFNVCMLCMVIGICLGISFAYGDDEKPKKEKIDNKVKISKLIENLGHEDFDVREDASDQIKKYGEEARPLLKAALKSEDLEVRLRAFRILGFLDGKKESDKENKKNMSKRFNRLKEGLTPRLRLRGFDEELLKDLFEIDSLFFDAPFEDIFKNSPFEKGFPHSPFQPFEKDLFGSMEDLMKRFEQRGDRMNLKIGDSRAHYSMERIDGDKREKLSLDINGDGSVLAKVITIDPQGEQKERSYQADSLEALKKEYPEIAEKFNLDSFRFGLAPLGSYKLTPPLKEKEDEERSSLPRLLLPDDFGKGKILGVYVNVDGPGPALRSHLGLKEGVGVIVERVQKNHFAEKAGVEPLDIIISINKTPVGSSKDIRNALAKVKNNAKVEIVVYRKGEKIVLSGVYEVAKKVKKM